MRDALDQYAEKSDMWNCMVNNLHIAHNRQCTEHCDWFANKGGANALADSVA